MKIERQRHEPPEQVAAELGDDPLPHHAEQVGLQEAADGLDQEQPEQDDDEAVQPGRVAAGHDLGRDPRDHQREGQPDQGRDDEPDERDPEPPEIRAEIVEQAPPRDATEPADLADDGARVGRHAGKLLGHRAMMAPTVDSRRRSGQTLLPVTIRSTGPSGS